MTARSSFYLAAAETYLGIVIGLANTIVLARLLTPAEIGTFSIAASFVGLAHAFRELGVTNYVIQEQELTDDRYRAAFTVSLLAAWPIGVVLALAAPWIAGFYSRPELTPIFLVLAANFILLPFGSVTLAYLRRAMLFGRSLVINVSASLMQLGVSIGFALMGMGAISMAFGATGSLLLTILLATLFRPRGLPWTPGFREIRRVFKFGVTVSGGSVAASLNESSPDLIIGKVLGATETGLFNKALGLTTMVKNLVMLPLWKVLLPYFSERSRSGENIASVYLRVVSLVTGFIWPALLVAGIAADPIVRLLLGEQWLGAIPLARILCIASAIAAVSSPLSSLLVGRSRADLYLRTAVVACLLRVAFLTATAPFAIEAVAWGFVVSSLAYVGYGAHILRRYMEIGTRQLLKSAQRSAMLTAAMVPFSVGAIWISAQLALSPINTLLTVSIASAACWLLTVSRIHPDAATEMRRIVNKLAPLMRFRRHEGKVS